MGDLGSLSRGVGLARHSEWGVREPILGRRREIPLILASSPPPAACFPGNFPILSTVVVGFRYTCVSAAWLV